MQRSACSAIATMLLAVTASPLIAQGADSDAQVRLGHIAVWTANVDKAAAFLNETMGWRRHPIQFGVRDDSAVFGGMKLTFVDANGFWLELVEPTTPGPGMELLEQKGNGTLVELDFGVADFDKTYARLKDKGIEPIHMDGTPLKNGGRLSEWVLKGGERVYGDENGGLQSLWLMKDGKRVWADERIMYLPLDVSRGTSIELWWDFPYGVVAERNATWPSDKKTPPNAPRLNHVVVLAADLAKTTRLYTDLLDLPRLPTTSGLHRDWMGPEKESRVWIDSNGGIDIEIVAPSGSAAAALLADGKYGDGALVEVGVEVKDIEAFYDSMKAKGITMMAGDSRELPPGKKSVTPEGTGDRYGYLPLDRSQGMRIMVFQRGPKATSLFP